MTLSSSILSISPALLLPLLFTSAVSAANIVGVTSYAPSGTLQLNPSVYVSDSTARANAIQDGDVVLLHLESTTVEAWCYSAAVDHGSIGVHGWLRDSLQMIVDTTVFSLSLPDSGTRLGLSPRPLTPRLESHWGVPENWPGMAVGAPHGDCDLYTGEIVAQITETTGLPSLAAYNFRYSGLGRWIDVNRPLGRAPRPGGGVLSERSIWAKPRETYASWRTHVRQLCGATDSQPLEFYCSFHGHDLKVTLSDGTRRGREVVESMGAGFSSAELRRIKSWYTTLAPKYFTDPPLMVFGNLPEDRNYPQFGQSVKFYYSGFGARAYGILRRDETRHALHFETPNSLRFDPQDRKKTAALFGQIFTMVRDSLLSLHKEPLLATTISGEACSDEMIPIAAGTYWVGAPEGEGWSAERPRHEVTLPEFALDIREVTNAEYIVFANEALATGSAILLDGQLCSRWDPDRVWASTEDNRPWSKLQVHGGRLVVTQGWDDWPVSYVSWNGAQAYVQARGLRLPYEVEWEAAAVGSTAETPRFAALDPWVNWGESGDNWENTADLQSWPAGVYADHPEALSPTGCADMSGNVAEWCADWYSYGYYKNKNNAAFPKGPEVGTLKSCRGGSWAHEKDVATVSFRIGLDPNGTYPDVGFRCATGGLE